MSSQHHVIIGTGPAGVTAAETIRKQSPEATITMIGGEGEAPYSRMAIPYLLEGQIGEGGTFLRQDAGHFETCRIDVVQGPVSGVDTSAKQVSLESGDAIAYDKLLIATGASPVRPPIVGLDQPGVHTCWTLEDARRIVELAKKGAPVVLVGAGFIGSIILEALAKGGVALTVVEMGDRMVPRMLDETAGNMLKRWCEKEGVRVVTGTTVDAIVSGRTDGSGADNPDGGARFTVQLGNGDHVPAELVVIAAGVRPNSSFLEGSGIAAGDGVTVDEYLATSAPDVYAAGDVAEGRDLSTGAYDMLAIQPVAVEHGFIAAMNMAGQPTPHRGSLNMNVLDTLGLISSSFGQWQGVDGGDSAVRLDEDAYRYIKLAFAGDKLVGAQCVGMTEHIGMLRGLIQTGLSLGPWKARLMEAPERLPEAYVATAQAIPNFGPSGPKIALPV